MHTDQNKPATPRPTQALTRRGLATLSFAPLLGLANAAVAATVTASPKTQPLGNVSVSAASVAPFTLSSDTDNLSVSIVKDAANCANGADMEVTTPPTFPANISTANPLAVEVTFSPLSRGTQSCQFDVMDDTAETLLETFSVTGTGVAPVLSVSESALNYGNVHVSDTKTLSFTVGNSTTDSGNALTINSTTLMGSSQYAITQGPTGLYVLQPGTQQTMSVAFKPTSIGAKSGYVRISSNDPVHPQSDVQVSGTGTAAIINLPPTALIADVVAGSSDSTDVAVANVGNEVLTVTDGTLTATGEWITFAGNPSGIGCAGGKTCTFDSALEIAATSTNVTVQCTPPPDASGSQSETLTFTSNTITSSNKQTTVTCTVDDVIFADAFEGP